jgi:hypothetical protein
VDACVFAELGDEATDEYTALGEQLASAAGHIRRSVMAFDELTRNNARAGVAGEQEKARRAIAGILERHAQSVTDLSLHVAGRLDRIDDALLAARATRRRAQVREAAMAALGASPETDVAIAAFEASELRHQLVRCACCTQVRLKPDVLPDTLASSEYESSYVPLTKKYSAGLGFTVDAEAHGDALICGSCADDVRNSKRLNRERQKRAARLAKAAAAAAAGGGGEGGDSDGRAEDDGKGIADMKLPARLLKFSGWSTPAAHLGPADTHLRHNNMHLSARCPVYLEGLTQLEMSLISPIAAIMNIHVLRGGMLASKGHAVTLANEGKIASELPWSVPDIGLLLIYDPKKAVRTKVYTVQRDRVARALLGCCFGEPLMYSGSQEQGIVRRASRLGIPAAGGSLHDPEARFAITSGKNGAPLSRTRHAALGSPSMSLPLTATARVHRIGSWLLRAPLCLAPDRPPRAR